MCRMRQISRHPDAFVRQRLSANAYQAAREEEAERPARETLASENAHSAKRRQDALSNGEHNAGDKADRKGVGGRSSEASRVSQRAMRRRAARTLENCRARATASVDECSVPHMKCLNDQQRCNTLCCFS